MQYRGWRNYGKRWAEPNPLFQSERIVEKKTSLRKHQAIWLVSLFAIIATCSIILFSDRWQIKRVVIETSAALSKGRIQNDIEGQLLTRRWGIFPQSHRLFFDRTRATQTIQQYVVTKNLHIQTAWDGTLHISFQQQAIQLFAISRNELYGLDQRGVVIEHITPMPKELPTLLVDVSAANLIVGQAALSDSIVAWILRFQPPYQKLLQTKRLTISLDDKRPQTAEVSTEKSWKALFDIAHDPGPQIIRLNEFLTLKKDEIATMHRIDLRFKEKIFFE